MSGPWASAAGCAGTRVLPSAPAGGFDSFLTPGPQAEAGKEVQGGESAGAGWAAGWAIAGGHSCEEGSPCVVFGDSVKREGFTVSGRSHESGDFQTTPALFV